MKDLVEGRDREDNVVVTGEVIEVHTFNDRPTIYAIQELGSDDRYIFGEGKLSHASIEHTKTTPEWQNEAGEPLYNPIAGWRADEDDRE